MLLKFLFWNIRECKGRTIGASLNRFADSGIDVFIFAEAPANSDELLQALNLTTPDEFRAIRSGNSRIVFFARQSGALDGATWKDRFEDGVYDRLTAVELQANGAESLLLVGAHFQSPSTGISKEGLADWARDAARDIKLIEKKAGHRRTLLVGDLNMNPFDNGIVSATALHGVMTRKLTRVVERHSARNEERTSRVFYNPMWSCLGDRMVIPENRGMSRSPASHYYNNTMDRSQTFWHLYDQVLLRPTIMERLTSLEILDSDGTDQLTTKQGKPAKHLKSDHLPIRFELDL